MLRSAAKPLYVVKRDISDYFASIDHELLLRELASLFDPADYLYRLLGQRVRFLYKEGGSLQTASRGIPFGTSIACLLANIYLTEMDRELESIPGLHYFRYADDLLLLCANRETAAHAAQRLEFLLSRLRLLDRWLAEEVLSKVFGGHKKGHFRRISFRELRVMGLPSLLHRRRMILSGRMESPFFIWQREKATRAFRGTVARLCRSAGETAFSSFPEAAAGKSP